MPDTDLDDILFLEDEESPDTHVRLSKTDVQRMREAAKGNTALRKELDGYKRRDAISEAGLTGLTDRQRNAVIRSVDEPTPENLRAEAEALGFIEPPAPDPNAVTDEELEAHDRVSAAGNGASGAQNIRHVTPKDVATWSTEKLMRLNNQHPDMYEALMRDQEIDLPPTFVL